MWADELDESKLLKSAEKTGTAADAERGSAVPRRPWRDVLFLVLFVAAAVAHGGVAAFGFARGDIAKLTVLPADTARGWAAMALQNAVAQLRADAYVLAAAAGGALVVGLLWVQLLKWFTRLFLYVTMFGASAAVVGVGVYLVVSGTMTPAMMAAAAAAGSGSGSGGADTADALTARTWAGVGVILIGLVLLCVCLFVRKRIDLTAAMFKEACRGLQARPGVLVVSLGVAASFIAYNAFAAASWVYLYAVPAERQTVRPPPGNGDGGNGGPAFEFDVNTRYLVLFQVFMWFWVNALLSAVLQMVVAGAVGQWYFARGATAAAVGLGSGAFRTLGRALTKSLGSLAIGALLVAIVQFLNYCMQRAKRAAARAHLRPLVWLLCCVQCALKSIEGIIKFVDRFAYIYIGLHGSSFCGGCRGAYELLARHSFSAVLVDQIGRFVLFVGKLALTALVVAVTFVALDGMAQPKSFVTFGVVAAGAYLTFNLFAHMISIGADTVFVAYLKDLELNGGDEANLRIAPELHRMLSSRQAVNGKQQAAAAAAADDSVNRTPM